MTDRAKSYSRISYSLSLAETACLLFLLVLFTRSGLSSALACPIKAAFGPGWALPVYLAAVYLLYSLVMFPLVFYHSFLLEHAFSLSTQNVGSWFSDQLKGGVLAYLVSLLLLSAFFWTIWRFPGSWWIVISAIWIAVNLLIAGLAPVVILPLFFKYRKLSDERLREKILVLAGKMGVKVLDVYEIDMSKKTVKANAGLIGWGASRRVIVGDTLREKYSQEEIEIILAHEFAHHKLRHLPKLIAFNAASAAVCFCLVYATNPFFLRLLGLRSLDDIAAVPLVFLYLVLFGLVTQPLSNLMSRKMERNADMMALKVTGMKASFVSAMEKLAEQNLADRDPPPLIKAFFYDHPPISERISYANQ
ncbi:MAG: M48 family metallopeptidase [Deltaproteobacteria bacterium]